jgi:hypothetical protein
VVLSNGSYSSIVFVDMGDYEKIVSNVIDHQKVFEMVLINNAMTALAGILAGARNGACNLENDLFCRSKLTQTLKA